MQSGKGEEAAETDNDVRRCPFVTHSHVVEPQYPAAVDRYLDLGQFFDVESCKKVRAAICCYADQYRAAYQRAYRALHAAGEVEDTLRTLMTEDWDRARLEKRTQGILSREIGRRGKGSGSVSQRFLGGPTCKGLVTRFDTVEQLADRIYVLLDSYGLGDILLQQAAALAAERRYDVIACPDENHPGKLLHLLIPELSLAFVTSREGMTYTGQAYRRIHLDSMLNPGAVKRCKARCRFYRRMHGLLMEEAYEGLRGAKASHDLLEAAYHPAVDFAGVQALAEREWQRIASVL